MQATASSIPWMLPPFSAIAIRASETFPRARFAKLMRNELEDMAKAGRADRISFRLEPGRWIDRDAAADPSLAARGDRAIVAEVIEAKVLDMDNFTHGGSIVDLGDWKHPRGQPQQSSIARFAARAEMCLSTSSSSRCRAVRIPPISSNPPEVCEKLHS